MLLINADAFGIGVSSAETVGQCQGMLAVGGGGFYKFQLRVAIVAALDELITDMIVDDFGRLARKCSN